MRAFGNMLLSLILLAIVPAIARADATANQCISCHQEVESENGPAHLFASDIHFQKGLGCQDCHGGNPALDDMDAVRSSTGYRGVPDRLEIPEFCARCHGDAGFMHEHNPSLPVDQLSKYKTSVHGNRLFQNKDRKVATCVSCHTAHRVADAKMPYSTTHPANLPSTCGACHSNQSYMAEYGIPTDQETKYRESVHGKALLIKKDDSAPVCNDCHGNHGAAPPGAGSLSAVCGMCHAVEANLYDLSPHKIAFQQQGLPMCETCHGNHEIAEPSDSLIGLGANQLCANCHNPDDQNSSPRQIDSMSVYFARITAAADSAVRQVREAGIRGMMITDEEFTLKEIDQNLIQMRGAIHAFSADSLVPYVKDGLTKSTTVRTAAAALVDEYYFRRWGLGISSIIITLLALALYLKIRSLGK